MMEMFANSNFNGDISNWDVSNVTNMVYMFYNSPFDHDISNWNVKNVERYNYIFEDASIREEYKPEKLRKQWWEK